MYFDYCARFDDRVALPHRRLGISGPSRTHDTTQSWEKMRLNRKPCAIIISTRVQVWRNGTFRGTYVDWRRFGKGPWILGDMFDALGQPPATAAERSHVPSQDGISICPHLIAASSARGRSGQVDSRYWTGFAALPLLLREPLSKQVVVQCSRSSTAYSHRRSSFCCVSKGFDGGHSATNLRTWSRNKAPAESI